jgi:S-adenosylmethionine hydrolase
VDPGVGTKRDIIAVLFQGHLFLAPDNGLLAPLAERPGAQIYKLDLDHMSHLGLGTVSATFHGRDIFAPVGAELAAGRLRPEQLGPPVTTVVPSWIEEPIVTPHRVTGVVVAVDNFGNLITNIEAATIAPLGAAVVRAGGRKLQLLRTYGDVRPGDYLALINSFGVLELARSEGSAAAGLGLGRGAPVVVSSETEAT